MDIRKDSLLRGCLGTGTSGHSTEPAGVQEPFGQCHHTYDLIFGGPV